MKWLKILLATLIIFFMVGGAGGVSASIQDSLPEAQDIVNQDEGITAYKVFKIPFTNQMTGEPMDREYRLPMICPMPSPATHFFGADQVSEHLVLIQFVAMDDTHKVIILVDKISIEGIALSYVDVVGNHQYNYLYDANGDPQPTTKEAILEVIKAYTPKVKVEKGQGK